MDDHSLYEGAMQVVPLFLIALFVDRRAPMQLTATRRVTAWLLRFQDRAIAVLGIVAFFTSMFVLAGVVDARSWTRGTVIAALGGSVGLLFGLIWYRLTSQDESGARVSKPTGQQADWSTSTTSEQKAIP